MSSISARSIRKAYTKDADVVSDFSMEVRDGEFLVLVGPSGCGKSTILRMIAGLEDIDGGELVIGDDVVNGVPARKRNVAMIFQDYALYPHMTVFDNMAFGLRQVNLSKAEIRARVEDAARVLQLTEMLGRKPGTLSGGQRQRVAMGRAIVREPTVFLMDEPLSNLDARLRVVMRSELAQLHQRLRTTTIYVTHDQTEAMILGERVAVLRPLEEGAELNLQQIASPRELYEMPANLFVASFIGAPAMNLAVTNFSKDSDGGVLDVGSLRLPVDVGHDPDGETLARLQNEPLVIGVRPGDVRLATQSEIEAGSSVTGRVRLVEMLGSDTFVNCIVPMQPAGDLRHLGVPSDELVDTEVCHFVARLAPDVEVATGDELELTFDHGKFHVFSAQSGDRLGVSTASGLR